MRTDPFIDRELQRTKAAIQRTAQATAQGRADALARQKKSVPMRKANPALAAANDALAIAQDDQMFYGQYRKDVARMTGVDIKRNPTDPNLKALQTAGRVGKPDPFSAKSRQFEQNILMSQAEKGGAFGPSYGSANAGAGNVKAQARNRLKSEERTKRRMGLDALGDAADSPLRTPGEEEVAAQQERDAGVMRDSRGKTRLDASIQQAALGPAKKQPTQATTFRSMGASHDPLDVEMTSAMRVQPTSPLDDILPMIEAAKAKRAPREEVAQAARTGRDARKYDAYRKAFEAMRASDPSLSEQEAKRRAFRNIFGYTPLPGSEEFSAGLHSSGKREYSL